MLLKILKFYDTLASEEEISSHYPTTRLGVSQPATSTRCLMTNRSHSKSVSCLGPLHASRLAIQE